MDKGTYILLMENTACFVQVGSLGLLVFNTGWHAYVGSALGPGGFARVQRHIRLSKEKNKDPRWHIDRLLLSSSFLLRRVYCIPGHSRIECRVAQSIGGEPVMNFGSSDCSCRGHLLYYPADPHDRIMTIIQGLSDLKIMKTGPEISHPGEETHR